MGEKNDAVLTRHESVMAENLVACGGVGLAAPQLDISHLSDHAVLLLTLRMKTAIHPKMLMLKKSCTTKIVAHSVQDAALADGGVAPISRRRPWLCSPTCAGHCG